MLINKKGIEIVDIRNDLKLPGKLDDVIHYLVENKRIEIRIPDIKKNLIVGVIYRHPRGRIDLFNVLLEKTLSSISKNDKLCFICGDLHINPLQLNHDPTQQFISSVLSENVISHIALHTRLSDHSATLIDHILVKYNKYTLSEEIVSCSLYYDITNHFFFLFFIWPTHGLIMSNFLTSKLSSTVGLQVAVLLYGHVHK